MVTHDSELLRIIQVRWKVTSARHGCAVVCQLHGYKYNPPLVYQSSTMLDERLLDIVATAPAQYRDTIGHAQRAERQ